MHVTQLRSTAVTNALFALLLVLTGSTPLRARLVSPQHQQDRAARIVADIHRETRLNEGINFWGEQHKTEIDQHARLFRANYYQILHDLQINRAFARCVISAKYAPDPERWFAMMDRFDAAAEELNEKDQARYYFAKGLSKMQVLPDKLDELPKELYTAARNGHPSATWSRLVLKPGRQTTGFGNQSVADALVRFARAYTEGEQLDEAFKMYVLAAKLGDEEPRDYLSMIEVAANGSGEKLAYLSSLLFLEVFSLRDGLRDADLTVFDHLPLHAGIPADEFRALCEKGALSRAVAEAARDAKPPEKAEPIKSRYIERFDSRYAQNIMRHLGSRDDLFEIAICLKYWDDSTVVNRFM
ncbi:MAG: hypothetical protein GF331_07595, partial [Chitinivibrionales bacterium]|nr:hypothetical protein [Chitinivibrionales bacterium]